MGERFQIVFCGEVSDDISRAQAWENIGKLFRNSGGTLPDFFDGKRYVLKRNLDRQAAENCRQQLLGHGLVCKIARMQDGDGDVHENMLFCQVKGLSDIFLGQHQFPFHLLSIKAFLSSRGISLVAVNINCLHRKVELPA